MAAGLLICARAPQNMTEVDIIIFVEDPGAANFIVGLPAAVAERGFRAQVWATGKATTQLAAMEEPFEVFPEDRQSAKFLDDQKAKVLLVGTSENRDTAAFRLIEAARERSVVSVGVVDGPSNAHHRFRGSTENPISHAPDLVVVADEAVRADFVALGMTQDRVIVGGHPRYGAAFAQGKLLASMDRLALRQRHFPDLEPGAKVVVFLSELSDGVNPDLYRRDNNYTLAGRGDVSGRTEIVFEEVLDALAKIQPQVRLIVRLHPKNTSADFDRWAREIDRFSDQDLTADVLEMLFAADLVVGLTTILITEAALAGCHTLSVIPRPEEAAWLPSIGFGLTPCASNREDLNDALESALCGDVAVAQPELDSISSGALERLADMVCALVRDLELPIEREAL
jgi:hypothetical protein